MDEEFEKTNENSAADEDNKSGISADLIRGHINTIILRTLYERDKYGYEIIEEIEAKSHGQYSLKQPTLYSALKRLESQGYINAYWKTDEVSQGGRRKYYTLTDSGREVTEKNQAEWEYSRSVIDNLISDRSFDFTQPAPTAVDFKILKNSTTRVPVLKDEESEETVEPVREVKYEEPTPPAPVAGPVQPAAEPAPVVEQPAPVVQEVRHEEPQPRMSEEERKIVHENYLKLISQPVQEQKEVPPTPYADNIDTEKLIYNNKPETERDYRNLINNLFAKTVQPKPEAPVAPKPRETAKVYVRYEDATVKAEGDGLTVNTAEYEVAGSRRKKYNLGAALFKCSLIIGVIMLLEFALCLIFRNELHVTLAYPFVIFAIACAQIAIFGALYATDVGKSTRKPSSLTYLTASIIFTVILVLIIIVTAILIGVSFTSGSDIMAKIVVPCIVALNIPVFTTCFYFFNK